MMYKCNQCGKLNHEDDLEIINTSYESYYGVGGMFASRTPLTLRLCAYCKSEEIERCEQDEQQPNHDIYVD